MKILPNLAEIPRKQWFLMMSSTIAGSMAYSLHFILEFSVLLKAGLPIFFIVFHFFGLFAGSGIALRFVSKISHFKAYIVNTSFMALTFISLILINQTWYIPFGLFFGGTTIGINFGLMYEQIAKTLEDRKFAGRIFALGFSLISVVMIVQSFIEMIGNIWYYSLYYIILLLLYLCFISLGRKAKHKIPQKSINFSRILKKKDNLPGFSVAFFYGFFFVNTYYISILILKETELLYKFYLFLIVFFIFAGLFSFPAGLIADILGRRFTILLGCLTQALAFLILSFINQIDITFFILFPLVLGFGFALSINTMVLIFSELPDREFIRTHSSLFVIFTALGNLSGVIIGELLLNLYLIEPAYLTVILLFIIVCASVAIFQLRETLPPKEELEWKNSLQYIYIIKKTGIPLYDQSLNHRSLYKEKVHTDLLSGVLTAISSVLQEIADNQSPLKLIKQEGFNIIIEEGKEVYVAVISLKELKIIKKKMQDFLIEFETFFEDLICLDHCDLLAFSPAKTIVKKYFY